MTPATPVSAAFVLPTGDGSAPLRDAVAAIDDVHADGNLPTIPVELAPVAEGDAYLECDRPSGTPVRLVIAPAARHPHLSFVHEVAHVLDLAALGAPGSLASATHPDLAAWRTAIRESSAYGGLSWLSRKQAHPLKLLYLHNLMGYDELWARSYAQFIASTGRHPVLLAQLADRLIRSAGRIYVPRQWDDDDFVGIAVEIATLFRRLGWIG